SVASIGKLAADLGVSPEDASARVSQAIEGMRSAAAEACGMTDPAEQRAYDAWLNADPQRLAASRQAARAIARGEGVAKAKKLVSDWRSASAKVALRKPGRFR
ncbi:hypothetical protein, partial [Amaricoccus solimangrovi]|uniref:hypothetical protein n=1 Tax=Amaricoccus solimangrovi TaxID=2589815 RepID=UPI001AEF0E3A